MKKASSLNKCTGELFYKNEWWTILAVEWLGMRLSNTDHDVCTTSGL